VDWSNYNKLVTHPGVQAALIVAAGLLVGFLVDKVVARFLKKLKTRPDSVVDGKLIRSCRYGLRCTSSTQSRRFGT
jgi:hypothetical protein